MFIGYRKNHQKVASFAAKDQLHTNSSSEKEREREGFVRNVYSNRSSKRLPSPPRESTKSRAYILILVNMFPTEFDLPNLLPDPEGWPRELLCCNVCGHMAQTDQAARAW